MTVATAAESKKANAAFFSNSRSAAVADNADAIQNIVQVMKARVESSAGDQDLTIPTIVTFCKPLIANYTNAPIGTKFIELSVDSTKSPTMYQRRDWVISEGGNLVRVLTAGDTTSGSGGAYPQYSAGNENIIDARGEFLASGTSRIVYARMRAKTSCASGEAVRAYAEAMTAVTDVHGLHATAQVSAGGSVTGEMAAVRATVAAVSGLTLSAGTLAALRLDSDLSSAVTGMTTVAWIALTELQSNKVPFLLATDFSSGGCIGATTGATAGGTLKVSINGTTKYIQLFNSAS